MMTIKVTDKDYPLSRNRRELLNTPGGINIDDIDFDSICSGAVSGDDCRISSESLLMQADIAETAGYPHVADNFRRAAEMVGIDSERLIEIYNALRPYRSSEEELIGISEELEEKYHACRTAAFVRSAASVLKQRNRLKGDR